MVSPQQPAAPALTLLSSPLGKKRTLSRNGQVLGHLRVKGLGETKYLFTIGTQKWRVWPVGSACVAPAVRPDTAVGEPAAPRPGHASFRDVLTSRTDDTWALVDQWDRSWLTFQVTGLRTRVDMTQPLSPWPAADPEWGLIVAAAICSGYLVSAAIGAAQAATAGGGSDNLWLTT